MAATATKAQEILDSAERLVRRRGYNGFSFRDLATEVGIKSASVHYHFPTKADLGAAVAHRYADRFINALGDPNDPLAAPHALLEGYVDAFRRALVMDRQMCLCGRWPGGAREAGADDPRHARRRHGRCAHLGRR